MSDENKDECAEFRAGWRAGMYYARNPHTSEQLQRDEDEAVRKYLESRARITQPRQIHGC